jgi:hypothetical protein
MIAILGWGSLIWKPEKLQYQEPWKKGGPVLPLEFSRITSDRPLTVVLDQVNGVACPTRFAWSTKTTLSDAVADLGHREGASEVHIGYIDLQDNQSSIEKYPEQINIEDAMRQWCKDNQISAAVWTAIPPNFSEHLGIKFSVEAAVQYLKSLPKPAQASALEYIQKTPAEVSTPLRRRIATEWVA